MDTLIRALSAAKDGRNYTKHEEKLWEKWHVRFDQLKTFKEMVRKNITKNLCHYDD